MGISCLKVRCASQTNIWHPSYDGNKQQKQQMHTYMYNKLVKAGIYRVPRDNMQGVLCGQFERQKKARYIKKNCCKTTTRARLFLLKR